MSSQLPTTNIVRRVNLHGGIIGLFIGGPQKALTIGLGTANAAHEELVFIIPDIWSASMNLLAIIILCFTLCLWCPAPAT